MAELEGFCGRSEARKFTRVGASEREVDGDDGGPPAAPGAHLLGG